ncbi:TRAP transporter small permease [Gynuella sp.]|uniref:TRAP transporter small permease n=1 Tax=Gynuella sp. TaxID=2969146 RepID=UPI003D1404F7
MKFLIKFEEYVAMIFLALIVLLVFIAATMRWLGHPVIWSVDMSQILFIWVCILGANQALRNGGHVGVDVITRHLPVRAKAALDLLLYLLVIAFLLVLIYNGAKLTWLNVERRFGDSAISYAWVTVAVPVGSALMTLSCLSIIVRKFLVLIGHKTEAPQEVTQ